MKFLASIWQRILDDDTYFLWCLIAMAIGIMLTQGCASSIGFHARTALAAAQAHRAACDVVEARIDAELASCSTERCVVDTAERNRDAATACDATGIALESYIEGIGVAHAADNGDALAYVMQRASSFVQSWMTFLSTMYRENVPVPNANAVAPLREEVAGHGN